MKKITLTIVLLFIFAASENSYAGYVGNPARIFKSGSEKKVYTIYVEEITDIVYDRAAKHQVDEMEVVFFGGAAGLIYNNWFNLYGGVGTAKVKEVYTPFDTRVEWESEYGFTWLTGGTFKLFDKKLDNFYNSNFLASLDIQYRNTGFDTKLITIDNAQYSIPDPAISHSSIEYNDWHAACAFGLDFGVFSPYSGIKYSDFESCVRAARNDIVFQKDNAEADNNFGLFLGTGVRLLDSLNINMEAGFIDENYLSGSLSYKF
ncbi:MAG: hypothetical protein V2A72_03220 [Candidatus Omnitrophota bacterium]